ncbi:hypothetical protein ACFQH6_10820 [Halobacteriaceae archaeon GCM10025711]
MTDTLPVHVNRDGVNTLAPETDVFEATGSFAIQLQNHGAPTHVHLHIDDDLSAVAEVETPNRYVERESTAVVMVRVTGSRRPVRGRLEIVTGYGSETAYVTVSLTNPTEEKQPVDVDENLGHRQQEVAVEPDDGGGVPLPNLRNVPVLALGGLAILLAIVAATIVEGVMMLAAVLVVLVGLVAAGYFLVQP